MIQCKKRHFALPLPFLVLLTLFSSGRVMAQDPTGRPSAHGRHRKPVKPKETEPEPPTVILTVLTEPAQCELFINGQDKGSSGSEGKIQINKLPLGAYQVEVRKTGFESSTRSFQAGSEAPTLVFKLRADIREDVKVFAMLVQDGKLLPPDSPNALDLEEGLRTKYPDRSEVVTMRTTLSGKLSAAIEAEIAPTLGTWREIRRGDMIQAGSSAIGLTKLIPDDKTAQARKLYFKGLIELYDWEISGADSSGADQSAASTATGEGRQSGVPGQESNSPPDGLAAAQSDLEAAVKLDSSWAPAQYQLARVYILSLNPKAAEAALGEALKLQPVWGAAHCLLAQAYYDEGRYKESVGQAEKAVQQEPSSSPSYATLGLARAREGQTKQGLKDLEHAVELDGASGLPNLNQGIVYSWSKKKKDREKAAEELKLALDKNSSGLEFQRSIASKLLYEIEPKTPKK